MLHTPGNEFNHANGQGENLAKQQYSTVVDENYIVIGGHVDAAL